MDTVSLMRDTGRTGKNDKYLDLVCIDNVNKKAHVVPLENKLGPTVYDAFMEYFKVLRYAKNIKKGR